MGIKASINKGLSKELVTHFPNTIPVERPVVVLPKIIDPNWFAGFTSGDGCFSVEVLKSSTYKIGYQVILKFSIIQHCRDSELLKNLMKFIDCGIIKERSAVSEFVVIKLTDINEKLIPLFEKHPIHGIKFLNYLDFCKIANLMNNKSHLTKKGLDKIIEIKAGMNTNRQ